MIPKTLKVQKAKGNLKSWMVSRVNRGFDSRSKAHFAEANIQAVGDRLYDEKFYKVVDFIQLIHCFGHRKNFETRPHSSTRTKFPKYLIGWLWNLMSAKAAKILYASIPNNGRLASCACLGAGYIQYTQIVHRFTLFSIYRAHSYL